MIALQSSNLSWADYDEWNGTLAIGFRSGRVYEYFGVPQGEVAGLLNASSHGKYFCANIRNRYRYRRVA